MQVGCEIDPESFIWLNVMASQSDSVVTAKKKSFAFYYTITFTS